MHSCIHHCISNWGQFDIPMNYQEGAEFEAIQKEDALQRISAMIKRYNITLADLQAILPDMASEAARKSQPEARLFDPFFDVR